MRTVDMQICRFADRFHWPVDTHAQTQWKGVSTLHRLGLPLGRATSQAAENVSLVEQFLNCCNALALNMNLHRPIPVALRFERERERRKKPRIEMD